MNRGVLILDVQTGSGYDHILKTRSGSDVTMKIGSGSYIIWKHEPDPESATISTKYWKELGRLVPQTINQSNLFTRKILKKSKERGLQKKYISFYKPWIVLSVIGV